MSEFTLAAFADEAGAEVSEQIRALQENGIPGIELRGVGEKNITDLTCEEAKELKKQLDRKLVIRKDREGSHISLNIL